jgi:hypothetical protein
VTVFPVTPPLGVSGCAAGSSQDQDMPKALRMFALSLPHRTLLMLTGRAYRANIPEYGIGLAKKMRGFLNVSRSNKNPCR